MEYQYVYLIREREFIQLNKPIYKIGKTKQSNFTRFSQYPKDSAMIFQSACSDCDICEKEIIKCFKIKYLQKKEIGNEYFEGDYTCMLGDIYDIITQVRNKQRIIENERQKMEDEIRQKIEHEIRQKIEHEIRQKIGDENRQKEENEWIGLYKYCCATCKYSNKSKFSLQKHFRTQKHIENVTAPVITKFRCVKCEKYYKSGSGLWSHIKKCED